MARESEKQALIARLEASRQHLGGHVSAIRGKLDVVSRIKGRFTRHPWLWFGASAGVGLAASRLLRRPRRSKKHRRGLFALALSSLLPLLKPWLQSLITREIQRRLLNRPDIPVTETRFPLSKS